MLPLLNFTALVNNSIAMAEGVCAQLLDFTVGSVLRALMEANATITLWVQWLILQVLAQTRLSTSAGPAADSFVNDFAMERLPATYATGSVTLSRYTDTQAALVPNGVLVKTLDGTQSFQVTNGPYTIPAGTPSLSVTVQALNAGSQGNVQAGAIGLLATAIPYVDTVVNPVAFTNGLDGESDAALRARFQLFINSRYAGTVLAVQYAVASVAQNLTCIVQENTPQPGFFTVTVDDGSGSPPTSTLSAVAAAVNNIRPVGTVANIQPPILTPASISIALALAPSGNLQALEAAVNAAVTAFVNALPVAATLPLVRLGAIVINVDPVNILNATILINGAAQDLVPPPTGVVRLASLAVG